MSDQSLFTSFQVHMTPTNNGTDVAIPNYIPSAFNKYVSVVSASIPVSFYNCVGAYLQFEYRNASSPTVVRTFKFFVPDGQYTVYDISLICRYTNATMGINFFLEYDTFSGKVRVVIKDDPLLVYFNLVQSTFAKTLGFVTLSKVPYTYGYSQNKRTDLQMVTSDYVADLSGIRNIIIQTNFNIMSDSSNKTLAKVPIDAPFGSIVQYRNPNGFRGKIYSDDVVSTVLVSILDEAGNTINFNGVAWSVTLQFDYLRPDPDMPVYDAADPMLQPESGTRPELTLEDNIPV